MLNSRVTPNITSVQPHYNQYWTHPQPFVLDHSYQLWDLRDLPLSSISISVIVVILGRHKKSLQSVVKRSSWVISFRNFLPRWLTQYYPHSQQVLQIGKQWENTHQCRVNFTKSASPKNFYEVMIKFVSPNKGGLYCQVIRIDCRMLHFTQI